MTLQIVEDCETFMGCAKAIIVSVYAVVVIVVITRIIFKLSTFTEKRLTFEIIPLSSAIIQSLLQLILNLFIMNTKLIITALSCQAFTFGIISTSCSQLCLRIKYPDGSNSIKKYTLIGFLVAQLISITAWILTIADVIPIDCNDWFSLAYLFPMAVMTVYTIVSVAFGSSIIRVLKENDHDDYHKRNQSISLERDRDQLINLDTKPRQKRSIQTTHLGSGYMLQLRKQLRLIEVLFVLTIIVQIIMDILRSNSMSEYISCIYSNGDGHSYEFQANSTKGHIFLIFYQIVQITPCLIAPYIFFYVPFHSNGRSKKNMIFNLLDSEIDDENDEQLGFGLNHSSDSLKDGLLSEEGSASKDASPLKKQNSNNRLTANTSNNYLGIINSANTISENSSNDGSADFFHLSRSKRQQTVTKMEDFMDRMSIKRDDIIKLDKLEQDRAERNERIIEQDSQLDSNANSKTSQKEETASH